MVNYLRTLDQGMYGLEEELLRPILRSSSEQNDYILTYLSFY